jgi:hypothetical protein
MADDNKWGPSDSGDQETPGESKSGGSSENREDGSTHHTDWNQSGRASWDEKDGDVSGQHTTDKKS